MAQMGEHKTRMEEVQDLIPTGGNLFAEFVFVIPCISFECQYCQLCLITENSTTSMLMRTGCSSSTGSLQGATSLMISGNRSDVLDRGSFVTYFHHSPSGHWIKFDYVSPLSFVVFFINLKYHGVKKFYILAGVQ